MSLTSYTAVFDALVAQSETLDFRPPAVPLIAHDPYFSIWSFDDVLTDGVTRHWTGSNHPLLSVIRIGGALYRLMGTSEIVANTLPQLGVQVLPTRTIYTFAGAGVEVSLTFLTPSLPDDIEVLSRPATYIEWTVRSADGQTHQVEVYFSASALLAVNEAEQTVIGDRLSGTPTPTLRIGSQDQPILEKTGDGIRIDWGYLMITGAEESYIGTEASALSRLLATGTLPASDEKSDPRAAGSDLVAASFLRFGPVGAEPVSQHVIVAYDDEYSVQLMGKNLRPYWRRNGQDAVALLSAAEAEYESLKQRSIAFDDELVADLLAVGGADYALIGCLAYRQSFAAQKVVADDNGQPLMFSKENYSNGCMGTVDVLYPAAPQLLLFSPALMKASLVPILDYAASDRWKWPFAPHDLGQYPKANGQVYGGGELTEEDQMPVEESGNMLILLAALAKIEGNADFSAKYWPDLQRWAEYLADKGFDPERQLSTDDFAGHLAHNVNLSVKAIEALAAYAYLAELLGKPEESAKYQALGQSFADRWVIEAKEDDHYRLAFDQADTWSQKYNLVWDRMLGFNLFPSHVAKEELAYYRTKINRYGLPLDSRKDYTKLDWEVWTATLSEDADDFKAMMSAIVNFLHTTPDRVPMTDWYYTSTPKHEGFQARSVVGGVFIKLLDSPVWQKYASRKGA